MQCEEQNLLSQETSPLWLQEGMPAWWLQELGDVCRLFLFGTVPSLEHHIPVWAEQNQGTDEQVKVALERAEGGICCQPCSDTGGMC